MKKRIITYICIILGFLALSYAYVLPVLEGKMLNQSDTSGWRGMAQEAREWNKSHPEDPALWSGSMFSGMPTTTYSMPRYGDYTQKIYNLFLKGKAPATYLFISLAGGFLLLLAFGVNPLLAAAGAIAITFCSYNLQIIQVGHNTKMQALAWMPWALAAMAYAYTSSRKRKWPPVILAAALFGLSVSFQVKAGHQQISYYLALMILLYAIVEFISLLAKKMNIGRFFATSALLLSLGIVGVATNSNSLLPLFEFTPYSMRGGTTKTSGDGQKGLSLDYATAWSYGWEELPNMLIPNFNGGSSAGALGPGSETYKLLKLANQPNLREVCNNLPLYWGPQPFTAGPMYMGAITIFLFLLGLLLWKGRDKWWLLAATILAILLSLGSHLMGFTRFAYDFLPFYNKFRTVSMSLVILQFALPLLGFMVLDKLVKGQISAEEFRKKGWMALAFSAGFCLVSWLFPGIAGSFTGASDAGMPSQIVDALALDRRNLLKSDALTSMLFILASFALLWWATRAGANKQNRVIACVSIGALCAINLIGVDLRYLNSDDFITPRRFNDQFEQRVADKIILADKDPSYRVLDMSVNTFNDSHPSYWHKSIGGYNAAKLQIYQEYIEKHISGEISQIAKALNGKTTLEEAQAGLPELEGLSKLNCRYIIIDGNSAPLVYPYAKGNAWFEADTGKITLTYYSPNELRYHYSSITGGKAVFSEVYYPCGWTLKVTDSGEELEMNLSDEVLRSAVLPAGEHDLVMRYAPESYYKGQAISRASSILLILLAVAAAALMFVKPKRKE